MTIWLCVIVQTVGKEWFTEFICACSDWVEWFRISQPVDSVIVTTIRKHTVEVWAAGEDLSDKESRSQLLSSVSQLSRCRWQVIFQVAVSCNNMYFLPGPQLPLQLHSITAHCPVPNCTAWWQRHMCAKNLSRVTAKQCYARSQTCKQLIAGMTVQHYTSITMQNREWWTLTGVIDLLH